MTGIFPVFNIALGLSPVLIGHFFDNVLIPWGQREPFILAGVFLMLVTYSAIWFVSPDWSYSGKLAWLSTGRVRENQRLLANRHRSNKRWKAKRRPGLVSRAYVPESRSSYSTHPHSPLIRISEPDRLTMLRMSKDNPQGPFLAKGHRWYPGQDHSKHSLDAPLLRYGSSGDAWF